MRKILKIAIYIFGVFVFVSVAGYALLTAYGYQFDLLRRNIIKTSILDIDNKLNDVSVFLNEDFISYTLPHQIKNLAPGNYNLSVLRPGYKTWEKKVKLEEDIATRVSDIILVPEDIESVSKIIKDNFTFTDFIYNKKYVVFINQNLKHIQVFSFNKNGEYSLETISYSFDDLIHSFYFADLDRIVFGYEDSVHIIDLRDKKINRIMIPGNFDNLYVFFNPNLQAFYLNSGSIYTADIDENSSMKSNTLAFKYSDTPIQNFIIKKYNSDIYIRFNNALYVFENGLIHKIDDDVISMPIFTGRGEMLYLKKGQEIVEYDFETEQLDLLARFADQVETVEVFGTGKHLFLNKSNILSICDLEIKNCFKLLDIHSNDEFIIPPGAKFFLRFMDNRLIKYNLQ